MTDAFATERPTPLALFGTDWTDRRPAPIAPKPKPVQQTHKLTLYESALVERPRTRPPIGAYALDDLDAAFTRCRYPTHDAPFLFCGAVTDGECSYCARHARECFRGR